MTEQTTSDWNDIITGFKKGRKNCEDWKKTSGNHDGGPDAAEHDADDGNGACHL